MKALKHSSLDAAVSVIAKLGTGELLARSGIDMHFVSFLFTQMILTTWALTVRVPFTVTRH